MQGMKETIIGSQVSLMVEDRRRWEEPDWVEWESFKIGWLLFLGGAEGLNMAHRESLGQRQNDQDPSTSARKDIVLSSRIGFTYGFANPNFNGPRNGLRDVAHEGNEHDNYGT